MDDRQLASIAAAEVRRLSRRMPHADAEDMVQEAMFQFYRYAQTNPIENPQVLLRRMVKNLTIDRYRSGHTQLGRMRVFLEDEAFGRIADNRPLADDVVVARQAIGAVLRFLMTLPERERTIYLAHALEGRTIHSLAAEYSKPQSTVADHIVAVRNRLRAIAGQYGYYTGEHNNEKIRKWFDRPVPAACG